MSQKDESALTTIMRETQNQAAGRRPLRLGFLVCEVGSRDALGPFSQAAPRLCALLSSQRPSPVTNSLGL